MAQRTYHGPVAKVVVDLPGRRLHATRDVPVDVDAQEAALLDATGEWGTPLTERPAPAKPTRTSTTRAKAPGKA